MTLLRPLLMIINKAAATSGNLLRQHNKNSFLITRIHHHSQLPWKMQKRSFTDGLSGGKVVEAFSWYPFLRSNKALTLYSTLAAGGLVWKWMGCGRRALLRFHPIGDYKLASSIFGEDSYFVSLLFPFLKSLKILARAIYLSILFTPAIAMAPFANYFGPQYRKVWLNFVYAALEKAGPAFIKWGQWAATRRDLFPTDLCIELSKLQTIKAPEHRFDYTKETVEKAFGRNLLDIFEDFEEAPVGSGHVTQVHRATLRCHNPSKEEKPRVVAVKVRHPGVNELVMMDLSIVSFFAKILSWIIPTTTFKWSRFDETLHKFAVFMGSQVDLSRKAEVLSCFHHSLNGYLYLAIPEPLYPLVHPDVLVETFEEGKSLARLIQSDCSLNPSSKVRDNIVHNGSRVMCRMFLVNKFINMDMSPRNILFSTDKGKPRFVVLDVGMTSNISLAYAQNVVRIIRAAGRRDGRTAAEETLKLSKKQECPYPYAFIEDVQESFTIWDKTKELAHPSEFLQRLFEKARDYEVNIDDSGCSVMGLFLVLEGWQQIVRLQSMYRSMQILHVFFSKEMPYRGVTNMRNERGHRSYCSTD